MHVRHCSGTHGYPTMGGAGCSSHTQQLMAVQLIIPTSWTILCTPMQQHRGSSTAPLCSSAQTYQSSRRIKAGGILID